MAALDLPHPKPTAQVQPYFDALGLDDTLNFLEAFGGTEIYIASQPGNRSQVVTVVGYAKTRALASISHRLQHRVPLAKEWRARVYSSLGLNNTEIALKLGVTDVSVREYLRASKEKRWKNFHPDQLPLFPND